MEPIARRDLLRSGGRAVALAGIAWSLPSLFADGRWAQEAAAQTPPTVEADFVALVAAINGLSDDAAGVVDVARWMITEFDKALPPLAAGAPSAAVAAVLDVYTVQTGGGAVFASADTAGRHAALEAMVKDPDPAIRQVANQVLPFASFAYWGDVTLGEPARPEGPRPAQWDVAGYLGPSHGHLPIYRDGSPEGFAPMTDFES